MPIKMRIHLTLLSIRITEQCKKKPVKGQSKEMLHNDAKIWALENRHLYLHSFEGFGRPISNNG